MGLYERTEEILVVTDYCDAVAPGKFDSLDSRVGGSAIHLYAVLGFGVGEGQPFPLPRSDTRMGRRLRKVMSIENSTLLSLPLRGRFLD